MFSVLCLVLPAVSRLYFLRLLIYAIYVIIMSESVELFVIINVRNVVLVGY